MSELFSIPLCAQRHGKFVKQLGLFEHQQPSDTQHPGKRHEWKLYVDGASRNNPGPAGAGIYILKDNMVIDKIGYFLGVKTNNEAEYLALVLGLLILRNFVTASDEVFIISDSQLLVRQIDGSYRVKTERLRQLHTAACGLISGLRVQIMHVLRAENSEADALANLGIDKKVAVPQELLLQLQQYAISI